MYTIGKLLSETPEKLSRTILTLVKLLLTLWISTTIFGSPFEDKELSIDNILQSFDPLSSLYYLLCATLIWFSTWVFLFDIIFSLIIQMITPIVKPETALRTYLSLIFAVKFDGEKITGWKPNVKWFTAALEKRESNPFIIKTRFDEFFEIGTVAYATLWYSEYIDWFNWQFWVSSIFLVNFLILAVLQRKWTQYYESHATQIRAQFFGIGRYQSLLQVLDITNILSDNYNRQDKPKFIEFHKKSTSAISGFPEYFVFRPIFISDEAIGKEIIDGIMNDLKKKQSTLDSTTQKIYITNIGKPEDGIVHVSENVTFIIVKDKDQMFTRISYFLQEYFVKPENLSQKLEGIVTLNQSKPETG